MSYKIAVVGATGNVGREMLKLIDERGFPTSEVVALASSRSLNKEVSFGEKTLKIQDLARYDFSDTDIAFSSPGGSVSAEFAPKAAAQGCLVIDNTSHFRMDKDIPLIVPEVNSQAMDNFRDRNIIANPNCSTIQMVVALKPLHDAAKIKRVVVSTYQSVSGAGKSAMDELYNQTKGSFMGNKVEAQNFSKEITFNVIPQIDKFMDDNYTKEEWKMMVETKKILGDENIAVTATCVRCPVFVGHAEAVNIEFENPISANQARQILSKAEGISVIDEPKTNGFITPKESVGEDSVFVSRIREDKTVKHGLDLWVVADNVRKGAALNTLQIAEKLIANGQLKPRS